MLNSIQMHMKDVIAKAVFLTKEDETVDLQFTISNPRAYAVVTGKHMDKRSFRMNVRASQIKVPRR